MKRTPSRVAATQSATARPSRSGLIALTLAGCTFASMPLGCTKQADIRSLWTMPGATARGQAPPPGTPGYAWAYAGNGESADNAGSLPAGDLPETGLAPRDSLWRGEEAAVLRLAERDERPIIVDFYADWCRPCMRMAAQTFADPQLRATMREHFLTLQINVTEETHSNREQLKRYAVEQLPTLLLITADGRELDRVERFISADELQDRLLAITAQQIGPGDDEGDPALHAHAEP